jgi:formylmethanofuran dehydrogenase subunit E
MFYTDDPLADFARHDAEQEAKLNRLPKCSECENPIQEETCFKVNGEYICNRCMVSNHQVFTEDVI